MLIVRVALMAAVAGALVPQPRQVEWVDAPPQCFGSFSIISTGSASAVVDRGIARYSAQLNGKRKGTSPSFILSINVTARSPAQLPTSSMREAYVLDVDSSDAELTAEDSWGALRGLETFSQLVQSGGCVKAALVRDYPRFPHRGILVDTARHYLPTDFLTAILDSMSINKFNVLHWHLVDAQSFPYQVREAPLLASRGAYSEAAQYSAADVQRVIAFAADRGIRVVPEIDVPGHAASWGKGYPASVAQCPAYLARNVNNVPLSPANSSALALINTVLSQMQRDFPGSFVHLGGDEVVTDCWTQDLRIAKWMSQRGFDAQQTFRYFIQQIQGMVDKRKTAIIWEESWRCCADSLAPGTVVDVWKDFGSSVGYRTVHDVVSTGRRAIISYGWYLDHLDVDWKSMYAQEPFSSGLFTPEQRALVLGGEASMWGEKVDQANWMERVWPRAAAVAERLWSSANVTDVDDAAARLSQHRCHMLARRYPVSPIAPGPPCL